MKKRGMTLRQKQMITGVIFVSPWIIGFICFYAFNIYQAVRYSLSEIIFNDTGGYTINFVGLKNYVYAFTEHATFNRILVESLSNILIDVPLITFFSLFIAMILNRRFFGRATVRAIFFIPVIMATTAIISAMNSNLAAIMGGISSSTRDYQTTAGFDTTALVSTFKDYGFPNQFIDYLVSAVSRVYDIVRSSGVQILIFLAALQTISPSLYEVAEIEGATKYESFWKITFPMVSPLILTNVVYTIVDLFSRSRVLEIAQTTAFAEFNFGLSAAISFISSASICIILLILGYLISKKVFYQT